jgi:hypothetical protein
LKFGSPALRFSIPANCLASCDLSNHISSDGICNADTNDGLQTRDTGPCRTAFLLPVQERYGGPLLALDVRQALS